MTRDAAPRAAGPTDPAAVAELFMELLRRTHLSAPSDAGDVIADVAAIAGARDVEVLLIDYDQASLVPLPTSGGSTTGRLSVAGTVPGRAFSASRIMRSAVEDEDGDAQRLWLPLLDGTERLGVLGLTSPHVDVPRDLTEVWERYAHLVAMLIVAKGAYGDAFEFVRRRRPLTIASELAWALAPPRVFATDDLALGVMLEPCYDNGGDALDYALNGRVLHVAVLDAMGHGLAAAGVAAFACAAYRQSRRAGRDLIETHAAMDAAVGEQFPDERFVTAVLLQLDLDTGRVTWISAGHPPPLVIRQGRHGRTLDATPTTPLGVRLGGQPTVASASLQPGDLLLLYTDGLTEARGADGEMFALQGLTQFIVREASAGAPAPETLRRLRQAVVGAPGTDLRDDATAVLVEWRRGGEQTILPETVA